jgi:hypothetical protein
MWKDFNSALREALNPASDKWTTKGVFRLLGLLLGLLSLIATFYVVIQSVLTNDEDWRRFTATISIVVGWAISVFRSISLAGWILVVLLVLVWILLGISVSNQRILEKLEDIESELSNINPDAGIGSYDDDTDPQRLDR